MEKIRLQKLLFLFAQQQAKAEYDFIPYKYGCYSYSANADMTAMVKRGFLVEDDKCFIKKDSIDYLSLLRPADAKLIQNVKDSYGSMSANELIKHTYRNFPFYAINSEVAEKLLNATDLEKIDRARPKSNDTVLYTIGYEGVSLEEYLVKLVKYDIKLLVDVRNNPLSMKYGFSKGQLKKYCASLGIEYKHIPEVGIQGNQRQELKTQSDYDKLFVAYCKHTLTETTAQQHAIVQLLKQYKRIALTCFEANICQCHRKHLAEAITQLPEFTYTLKHI